MLVHQGEFEAEFNDCNERISDCFLTVIVSADGLKRACSEQCLASCPDKSVKQSRSRNVDEQYPRETGP